MGFPVVGKRIIQVFQVRERSEAHALGIAREVPAKRLEWSLLSQDPSLRFLALVCGGHFFGGGGGGGGRGICRSFVSF